MPDVDVDQDKSSRPRGQRGVRLRLDAAGAGPQKRGRTEAEERAMTAYDPDNIFAKILRGEIPAIRLYEDDETLCFMDIMPRADGHCLVIPKTPCRNVLDAAPDQLSAVMRTVQKMSRAVMRAFGAGGVTLQQFNEAPGGQEVFHLHFHILPRHDGVSLRPPGKMAEMDVLNDQAEKIRAALD
jgi:histidine triad (HIT) family protein